MGPGGYEESVCGHFGRAPYFVLVDTGTDGVEVIENKDEHHGHGQCQSLSALTGKDIDGVAVRDIGHRALAMLNAQGFKVFRTEDGTVGEAAARIKTGEAVEFTAEGACCGHGHGHGCCG